MTAATHEGSSTSQPSSQMPSPANWQSSEHKTGAGYQGASAGLDGGDGGMGGAGIEGGAGDSILTSPHRSFGAVRKASTSAIVAPTYALGFPFSDAPAITAKVSCTAPAKPRARICQQVRARLNIGGRGHAERMPHLHRQPRGVDQALVGTDRGRSVDGHLVAAMDRALLPVGQQQHELAHAGATAFAQQVGTRVQRRGDGRGACRGAVEAQPVAGMPLVGGPA